MIFEEMSTTDGIMFKGRGNVRIKSMRKDALATLHTAYKGIVKSKQLAKDLVYWPGLNNLEMLYPNVVHAKNTETNSQKNPFFQCQYQQDLPLNDSESRNTYCMTLSWL